MSEATAEIAGRARRVILAQAVVTALLGTGLLLAWGPLHGLSAVYGGLVGFLLTLLLSRSVRRAAVVAETDPKRGMIVLYVGAVLRFVFFLAAFAIGLGFLDLHPLATAAGFVAAQLAQLVNARTADRTNEGELK